MQPARLQKLHRAVDRHATERVAITPMQAGGYVVDATPTAPAEEVAAYVTETSTPVRTSGNAANSGHNAELRGATHTAKFSTGALPFEVLTGYQLTRLDKDGQPRFRVAAVLPFGTDRTVLMLVKVAT